MSVDTPNIRSKDGGVTSLFEKMNLFSIFFVHVYSIENIC